MKTIREQLEPTERSELEHLATLIAASQAISLKRIADVLERRNRREEFNERGKGNRS